MSIELQVTEIYKTFHNQRILRSASLEVEPGHILGLLGPNGAGKSTLLNIICGLLPADSGTVLFNGAPYHKLSQPIRRVGALLNPQWLDKRLTCQQILEIHALRLRLANNKKVATSMLAGIGLSEHAHKKVSNLSLGMRQRLAIGMALLGNPEFLILDEPINGLDAEGVSWIRSMLLKFAEDGGSVILSSHLMSEVELTATDVAILNAGIIQVQAPLSQLQRNEKTTLFSVEGRADDLVKVMKQHGCMIQKTSGNRDNQIFEVSHVLPSQVFDFAVSYGVTLNYLAAKQNSLESIYFSYLNGSV